MEFEGERISIPETYHDDFIVVSGKMAVAMIEMRTVCGETSDEERREGALYLQSHDAESNIRAGCYCLN